MNSNGDVDRVVEEIARREVWLRSYGMAPYTVSAEFDNAQVIRQMIDACKSLINIDLPSTCEKTPGVLSVRFREHLDHLKEQCLTSSTWSAARDQLMHAMKHHRIEKVVVLGLGSIFDWRSEHVFWQYEISFVLAIFELAKQQAHNKKTATPTLLLQDPHFCNADVRLLDALGGRVVEHLEAFVSHIDEHTFVFAKAPPHDVTFPWLFKTSPAVCVTTDISLSVPTAETVRGRFPEFDYDFDISGVAKSFMNNRNSVRLSEMMLQLYADLPDARHDFLSYMCVSWLMTEEDGVDGSVKARELGALRTKAKQWLETLQ